MACTVTITSVEATIDPAGVVNSIRVSGNAQGCDEVTVHFTGTDRSSWDSLKPAIEGADKVDASGNWEVVLTPDQQTVRVREVTCNRGVRVRAFCSTDPTCYDDWPSGSDLHCCPTVTFDTPQLGEWNPDDTRPVTVSVSVSQWSGRVKAQLVHAGIVVDEKTSATGTVTLIFDDNLAPGAQTLRVEILDPPDCAPRSLDVMVGQPGVAEDCPAVVISSVDIGAECAGGPPGSPIATATDLHGNTSEFPPQSIRWGSETTAQYGRGPDGSVTFHVALVNDRRSGRFSFFRVGVESLAADDTRLDVVKPIGEEHDVLWGERTILTIDLPSGTTRFRLTIGVLDARPMGGEDIWYDESRIYAIDSSALLDVNRKRTVEIIAIVAPNGPGVVSAELIDDASGDVLLSKSRTYPFILKVDRDYEPGEHQVSVRVTEPSGCPPLPPKSFSIQPCPLCPAIQLSRLDIERGMVGGKRTVNLEATVTPQGSDVVSVELVDDASGAVLQSGSGTGPFDLSATREYEPGTHEVTVRVIEPSGCPGYTDSFVVPFPITGASQACIAMGVLFASLISSEIYAAFYCWDPWSIVAFSGAAAIVLAMMLEEKHCGPCAVWPAIVAGLAAAGVAIAITMIWYYPLCNIAGAISAAAWTVLLTIELGFCEKRKSENGGFGF